MSRLLFWLALVFLVLFAIRSKLRGMRQPPRPAHRAPQPQAAPFGAGPATAAQPVPAETMLCCARCSVYYPASENVAAGGQDYCCAAHAAPPSAP